MTKYAVISVLAASLFLFACQDSTAYELNYTSDGKIIKRLSGMIDYNYYPSEYTFFGQAISGAMQEWNKVDASAFIFKSIGQTETRPASLDGHNSIFFSSPINDLAFAENRCWINLKTGNVFESDILINPDYNWSDGGKNDLRTVLLHEMGHTLRLGHSTVPGAVMGAIYSGGRMHLADDDKERITFLFPSTEKSAGGDSGCFITTVSDEND